MDIAEGGQRGSKRIEVFGDFEQVLFHTYPPARPALSLIPLFRANFVEHVGLLRIGDSTPDLVQYSP
jgi:hypothetical protein